MTLAVVILAAGKGSRMKSNLPKVLHAVAGKPMVKHVIDSAAFLSPEKTVVVVGPGAAQGQGAVSGDNVHWALQAQQLGTGHAVAQAMPEINEDVVLILYGDVPLIQPDTLQSVVDIVDENTVALMTLTLDDPSGYGRIVRDGDNTIQRIVEQKDANDHELGIQEINTGIMACPRSFLEVCLPKLSSNNAQGEYYLTDVIAMAVQSGLTVESVAPAHPWEVDGVNDRLQLSRLERIYQRAQADALMREGVTVLDPARLDIRGVVQIASDVVLDVNVVLEGEVTLESGVMVGPNCIIRDSNIGAGTVIDANSVIDGSIIGEQCSVGPFARLRPGTALSDTAKVGNFVETKNAHVGHGSKINHLSYIGDSTLGKHVNVGAGTITCNYDGANKYQTVLADGVFIGSNSALVAPVSIGENATIGAGSTITKDVDANDLGVARSKQRNVSGWQRPGKN